MLQKTLENLQFSLSSKQLGNITECADTKKNEKAILEFKAASWLDI